MNKHAAPAYAEKIFESIFRPEKNEMVNVTEVLSALIMVAGHVISQCPEKDRTPLILSLHKDVMYITIKINEMRSGFDESVN